MYMKAKKKWRENMINEETERKWRHQWRNVSVINIIQSGVMWWRKPVEENWYRSVSGIYHNESETKKRGGHLRKSAVINQHRNETIETSNERNEIKYRNVRQQQSESVKYGMAAKLAA
jgi:hypothetical protein